MVLGPPLYTLPGTADVSEYVPCTGRGGRRKISSTLVARVTTGGEPSSLRLYPVSVCRCTDLLIFTATIVSVRVLTILRVVSVCSTRPVSTPLSGPSLQCVDPISVRHCRRSGGPG